MSMQLAHCVTVGTSCTTNRHRLAMAKFSKSVAHNSLSRAMSWFYPLFLAYGQLSVICSLSVQLSVNWWYSL